MTALSKDYFLEFTKNYVKEAGGCPERIKVHRGFSLQTTFDITGYACVKARNTSVGYEIFEFEHPETSHRVLISADRMTNAWIAVEYLDSEQSM